MRTFISRYADALLLTFLILLGGGGGFGAVILLFELTGRDPWDGPMPAVGLHFGAIAAVCVYYVCMGVARKIKAASSEDGEEADYDETLPRSDEA